MIDGNKRVISDSFSSAWRGCSVKTAPGAENWPVPPELTSVLRGYSGCLTPQWIEAQTHDLGSGSEVAEVLGGVGDKTELAQVEEAVRADQLRDRGPVHRKTQPTSTSSPPRSSCWKVMWAFSA